MFLSVSLPVREFSPQLSVEVVAGKRLRVTTRCVRPAMLGPASAGVGVSRNGTFSLNGGQLAREPEEQERGGIVSVYGFLDTFLVNQAATFTASFWMARTAVGVL
jgi:hypothetical protein